MLSDKNFSVGLEAIATKFFWGLYIYIIYFFNRNSLFIENKNKNVEVGSLEKENFIAYTIFASQGLRFCPPSLPERKGTGPLPLASKDERMHVLIQINQRIMYIVMPLR